MDIWEKLYEKAKEQYRPEEITPFIEVRHVVCALEAENGEIFSGFNIEGCSGVMNLCAERVAALRMYADSSQTVVRRIIAFRDRPPKEDDPAASGMPCGACREFFLQLDKRNADMEIMLDFDSRKTVLLKDLIPHWWGWNRYGVEE